ncbi:unnamed protein product, partial [Durusdinium trenchii]
LGSAGWISGKGPVLCHFLTCCQAGALPLSRALSRLKGRGNGWMIDPSVPRTGSPRIRSKAELFTNLQQQAGVRAAARGWSVLARSGLLGGLETRIVGRGGAGASMSTEECDVPAVVVCVVERQGSSDLRKGLRGELQHQKREQRERSDERIPCSLEEYFAQGTRFAKAMDVIRGAQGSQRSYQCELWEAESAGGEVHRNVRIHRTTEPGALGFDKFAENMDNLEAPKNNADLLSHAKTWRLDEKDPSRSTVFVLLATDQTTPSQFWEDMVKLVPKINGLDLMILNMPRSQEVGEKMLLQRVCKNLRAMAWSTRFHNNFQKVPKDDFGLWVLSECVRVAESGTSPPPARFLDEAFVEARAKFLSEFLEESKFEGFMEAKYVFLDPGPKDKEKKKGKKGVVWTCAGVPVWLKPVDQVDDAGMRNLNLSRYISEFRDGFMSAFLDLIRHLNAREWSKKVRQARFSSTLCKLQQETYFFVASLLGWIVHNWQFFFDVDGETANGISAYCECMPVKILRALFPENTDRARDIGRAMISSTAPPTIISVGNFLARHELKRQLAELVPFDNALLDLYARLLAYSADHARLSERVKIFGLRENEVSS